MADFISRDKAVFYLEETAEGLHGTPLWAEFALHLADGFKELPSADVVEVVRCKDCIYYNETHEACDCDEKAISSLGIFFPNADDFCSYGERKELDNDTH